MRFVADECCDAGMVASLRSDGHDIIYISETCAGAVDEAVLHEAYREHRILLTEDKDFGELVFRLQKPAFSIVLMRLSVASRKLKWPRLRYLLGHYPQRLPGHFVTVDEEKYRFRPLRMKPAGGA
ncbi:MAG: DUF5615 family PIN-like protein [Burkholderiales bacterium]